MTMALSAAMGGGAVGGMAAIFTGGAEVATAVRCTCGSGRGRGRGGGFPPQEVMSAPVKASAVRRAQKNRDMRRIIPSRAGSSSEEYRDTHITLACDVESMSLAGKTKPVALAKISHAQDRYVTQI
jgi:hypothetical protein